MTDKDPHSVFNEPHLGPGGKVPDASEARAEQTLGQTPPASETIAGAGQGVYEEPAIFPHSQTGFFDQDWSCSQCGANLRGRPVHEPCRQCGHREYYRPAPAGQTSYQSWLRERMAVTSERVGWGLALIAAVLGGVFSVVGAFFEWWAIGPAAVGTVVLMVVFGPALEETLKVSVAAMLVERRPYLFQRAGQIQLAAVGAALVFAILENLLYLNVYIDAPTTGLRLWRWTACVGVHVGCTAIAVQGVVAVWRRTTEQLRPPLLTLGLRPLVMAIVLHGAYNMAVLVHQLVWGPN